LEDEPIRGRARRRAHHSEATLTNVSLYEDSSDNEVASLPNRVSTRSTQRKIEELPDIRTLDELVQRRIQEAKLQFLSGPTLAIAKVSDLLSTKRLCEFSKRLTPTFDYYFGVNNTVQHIRHF